jgi:hypothetical protein
VANLPLPLDYMKRTVGSRFCGDGLVMKAAGEFTFLAVKKRWTSSSAQ